MSTHVDEIKLPDPLPKFLTVPEVAALLRASHRTIYDWVSQQKIPYRKAGGKTLFDRDEILRWTETGKNSGAAISKA